MSLGVMLWSRYSESPSPPQQYARSKDQDAAEDCVEPGPELPYQAASLLLFRITRPAPAKPVSMNPRR